MHALGGAANDHCSFIELLMTAETSLKSGICTQGHRREDCANGEISHEISRMGLNGRVYEPRSVKRQAYLCSQFDATIDVELVLPTTTSHLSDRKGRTHTSLVAGRSILDVGTRRSRVVVETVSSP